MISLKAEETRVPERLARLVKTEATRLGLHAVAIGGAEPFRAEEEILRVRAAQGMRVPFTPRDPALRCRPERVLPGARSLITVALSYYRPFPRREGGAQGDEPRGVVARYAWGRDYHVILQEKLGLLASWLGELAPGTASRVLVDTGPLVERAAAVRAGLGWVGKNTCLITPRFGSWVVLGVVITTAALAWDRPLADGCGNCDLCLRACPTGALVAPGVLDHRRCLSYVTQMKGVVPAEFRARVGRRVWGCDTCQVVCPHNRDLQRGNARTPGDGPGGPGEDGTEAADFRQVRPALVHLLGISEEEFRAEWGHTAIAWRGRAVLRRNAAIALGNALAGGQESAVTARAVAALGAALEDDDPGVRAAAAWALGRLLRNRKTTEETRRAARTALARARSRETHPAACAELDGRLEANPS